MNHLHCRIFSRDDDYLREISAGGSRAETAISCLYLRYRKRTMVYLQRMISKYPEYKGVPEDLVQDSFIIMVEKIQHGSCQIQSLAGFWMGIGKHLLLNQLKKDQRIILVHNLEDIYEPADTASAWMVHDQDEHDQLEHAISRLGPKCREILLLWVNRYSMTEIAQIMKLSNAGMARKTKYDCFKKLKELVKSGYIQGI